VRKLFAELITAFARESTGVTNRITRAILMAEGPSLEAGEITDKGSLNQSATLRRRAAMVGELYAPEHSGRVIEIEME
jgi:feruloyl-CoA synthase